MNDLTPILVIAVLVAGVYFWKRRRAATSKPAVVAYAAPSAGVLQDVSALSVEQLFFLAHQKAQVAAHAQVAATMAKSAQDAAVGAFAAPFSAPAPPPVP